MKSFQPYHKHVIKQYSAQPIQKPHHSSLHSHVCTNVIQFLVFGGSSWSTTITTISSDHWMGLDMLDHEEKSQVYIQQ